MSLALNDQKDFNFHKIIFLWLKSIFNLPLFDKESDRSLYFYYLYQFILYWKSLKKDIPLFSNLIWKIFFILFPGKTTKLIIWCENNLKNMIFNND